MFIHIQYFTIQRGYRGILAGGIQGIQGGYRGYRENRGYRGYRGNRGIQGIQGIHGRHVYRYLDIMIPELRTLEWWISGLMLNPLF